LSLRCDGEDASGGYSNPETFSHGGLTPAYAGFS
jgi:hypothetical protein